MSDTRERVGRWLRWFDCYDEENEPPDDWDGLEPDHQKAYLKHADELLVLIQGEVVTHGYVIKPGDWNPIRTAFHGALRDVTGLHGPITKQWESSAVKRLVGQLKTLLRDRGGKIQEPIRLAPQRDHEAMEKLRRLSVPDPHNEGDLGMFWEFTTNKLGEAALWGCPDRSKNDPADAILEADDETG